MTYHVCMYISYTTGAYRQTLDPSIDTYSLIIYYNKIITENCIITGGRTRTTDKHGRATYYAWIEAP